MKKIKNENLISRSKLDTNLFNIIFEIWPTRISDMVGKQPKSIVTLVIDVRNILYSPIDEN